MAIVDRFLIGPVRKKEGEKKEISIRETIGNVGKDFKSVYTIQYTNV